MPKRADSENFRMYPPNQVGEIHIGCHPESGRHGTSQLESEQENQGRL